MLVNGVIMDLNSIFKFILVSIIPFLGLLAWLENIVSNSKEVNINNYSKREEELVIIFEENDENNSKYCSCSFCGKVSNLITRCSICKNAQYCSKLCHMMHWRFWHKEECVEIEMAVDQDHTESSSPSHGTSCLLLESENEYSKYSMNEDVHHIEDEEQNSIVEFSNETSKIQHENFSGYYFCAVCGNPSSKICSRCKAVKYCSQTCQHFDWRSGHQFECLLHKENSTHVAKPNQEKEIENDIMPLKSNEVKDTVHSSYGPLCLEFYSEENSNSKALILSSQEDSNKMHKIEEQLRSLQEDFELIKKENISLRSERDDWEIRATKSVDRLCSFKKENQHQLFLLKHENELISNSEKQARLMVNTLSQRLHCLQIAVETKDAKRKKDKECIHMLKCECSKVKKELQEQNEYIERLSYKINNANQFPMKSSEKTGQELFITSVEDYESKAAAVEVTQPTISLSRNLTFSRQGCSICLTNEKDLAFGCGHMSCRECGSKIRKCHICRTKITTRIRLFPG